LDEEETEATGKTDKQVLMEVQDGFKIKINELPKEVDASTLAN
jgi:DNA-binding Lrp family transcriptional regulator